MKIYATALLIAASTATISCSSSKSTAPTEVVTPEYPSWVTNRPLDNSKYIGIAGVKKNQYPGNYSEMATKMALNEMSGQIKVVISSNSMLYTFEDASGQVTDEYKEFIQTTTDEVFENYTLIDSWEDSNEYWVWYELSKAQYETDKQKRIQNASVESLETIEQGDKLLATGNYSDALSYYLEAIDPIKSYIGEQIQVDIDGESVYLGQYILNKIQAVNEQFKLIPLQEEAKLYWGENLSDTPLTFQLLANKNPVSGFPVELSYTEGRLSRKWTDSDALGVVNVGLSKVKSTAPNQQINAQLDFAKFYNQTHESDEVLNYLLNKLVVVKSSMRLKVRAPQYKVEYRGDVLNATDKENINSSLDVFLGQKGMMVTQANADVILKLTITKATYGKSYDFESCILSGDLSVHDVEGNLIYKERIADLKGVHKDKNTARDKAIEKLISKFNSTYLPRFYRKFMK